LIHPLIGQPDGHLADRGNTFAASITFTGCGSAQNGQAVSRKLSSIFIDRFDAKKYGNPAA
jgi:hypothetical protein